MDKSTKVAEKMHMSKNNYTILNDKITNYFFIALISVLLVAAPFYRGLYFRENYMPSIIYLSGVFLVYSVYKLKIKEYKLIDSYMDIAVMLLPFVYLISFFFSINTKLAFDAVLKYAAYFMIYKLACGLCRGNIGKRILLYVVVISNFLTSITGLLTMAGIMDLKGVVLYNRIYGLYQYPNTTGAVLGAGFLICVLMLSKSRNVTERLFLQIALTTIFAGFILTLSLGSFLIFGVLVLVFFIFSSYKARLNILANIIISVLANILVFIGYFQSGLKESFIFYYTISVAISLLLQYISYLLDTKYIEKLDKKRINSIVAISIAAILVFVIGISIIKLEVVKPLFAQLWDAGLKIQNASDRLTFSKDGMRIFLDNPLLGTGGGTWQDTYYKYQSFSYNSAEAHNFYIQFLTEVGIIGGVVFLSIIYLLLRNFAVQVLLNKDDVNMPIFAGVFMIIGHAFIDFDLSLSAPMLLLWLLIGMLSAGNKDDIIIFRKFNAITYGIVVCSIIVIYLSSTIYAGMANGNNASKLVNKDTDKAILLYEKAMRLDRFNGAYRMDYALLMVNKYISTKTPEYLDIAKKALDKVEELEPQNAKYIPTRINLLFKYGEIEKGVDLANRLVVMQPLVENAYINKIQANYEIAKYYFSNKQFKEALPYLNNMIATEEQLNVAKAKSIKPFEVNKNVYDMINLAKNWKENAEKRIGS